MSKSIAVFTDGSSDPGTKLGSWSGIIVLNDEKKVLSGIEKDASQHKMELFAVLESLNYILNHFPVTSNIIIYTYSEYVLNLLNRRKKLEDHHFKTKKGKPVVYADLIRQFYSYTDHYEIELKLVRGHQKKGVSERSDYNREADKLSRKILREELGKMKN